MTVLSLSLNILHAEIVCFILKKVIKTAEDHLEAVLLHAFNT